MFKFFLRTCGVVLMVAMLGLTTGCNESGGGSGTGTGVSGSGK